MTRKALATALVGLAFALFPALAGATTFSVNVATDVADAALGDGVCDADAATAGSQCSLRAAIETANEGAAADEVGFGIAGGTTIQLISQLEVTQPLTIAGCASATATEPCIGVRGFSTGFEGVVVRADNVTLRGLAITNAATGVNYEAGFTGLVLEDNWIGIALGGTSGANGVGVNLSGNGATIGGEKPEDRNVIGFNETGVRVSSGDSNRILGNYIGVKANGTTAAANNPSGAVVVTGNTADLAEGNTIGGRVSAAAAATAACDGACNVIANSSTKGVNLKGLGSTEAPSVGSVVMGNFIGLNATGAAAAINGMGIDATGASGAVIGGPSAEERNFMTGGTTAIQVSSVGTTVAPTIQGNFIGLRSDGSALLSPPSTNGILAQWTFALPGTVSDNRIVMSNGSPINMLGAARVSGNVIGLLAGGANSSGGATGIRLQNVGQVSPNRYPSQLTGNTIANSTSAAIALEGGRAVSVTGNQISGSPSLAGILVKVSSTSQTSLGNTIGGDGAEANQIEDNAATGAAILVEGDGQDGNEVLGNKGTAKTIFVDLAAPTGPGNDPASGPNAGIQPPTIIGAGWAHAAGTAEKGAKVGLFVSSSAAGQAPAGLGTQIATATADSSGKWSIAYAPIPSGTVVAAMQTDAAGNSSEPTAGAALDETPPGAATIDAGPEGPTNQSRPTFKFHGEAGAGFRCVVDSAPVGGCDSGELTPATLADGPHSFTVVQFDAAGNEATAAATRTFTVDTVAPAVAITAGPSGPTNQSAPIFTVTGEAGGGLRCAIDAGLEVPCDSGSYTSIMLVNGPHSFHVSQTDAAGNTGAATRSFEIDTVAPAAPQITGGPTKATAETRPTFSFEGETGAGFRCAIDTDALVACNGGSFTPAAALADGAHVFHVSQTDAAGNAGPEATREFTVATTSGGSGGDGGGSGGGGGGGGSTGGGTTGGGSNSGITPPEPGTPRDTTPPDTKIAGPARVKIPTARFKLSSTESGSSFQCSLDRKPFKPCAPKFKAKKLKRGKHVLKVRAVDAAGNVDATPAKKVLRVGV